MEWLKPLNIYEVLSLAIAVIVVIIASRLSSKIESLKAYFFKEFQAYEYLWPRTFELQENIRNEEIDKIEKSLYEVRETYKNNYPFIDKNIRSMVREVINLALKIEIQFKDPQRDRKSVQDNICGDKETLSHVVDNIADLISQRSQGKVKTKIKKS